ncbi:hypothetical protein P152DRAFT_236963 [Eremomyces bilateralis CBS 781.70]|uniref:Phosphatidylserine decarboxylase proenzyme 2 n=1 Tax=Eremomyces bilateralis CBS 781.70 TaxID=1392243 RepID=A0A6G1G9Y2_9PEZI|nr:uncharacterized protein P152DRAFT_236963 [Eremomyces bilateralis CBS 781.70]KAF1814885.1 hypothetical protein P152DRAFT_236963 [Eremomyces bilateralis CBS 781.70]
MPRPALPGRLSSFPNRLKGNNTPTANSSRSTSPKPGTMLDAKDSLVLKVKAIKGQDLAAKDRTGTSDPYLVVTLGDARSATSTIPKTLNPEWNQDLEFPVVGVQSLLLEAVCWDKDRFGKDYMGEFAIALDDVFSNGEVDLQPAWYPLESRRTGKKSSFVTGRVQLHLSLSDPSNPAATPQQIIQKFSTITGADGVDDDDEKGEQESPELEDEDEIDEEDGQALAEKTEETRTKKRRRRIAKLRRKAKQKAYEFNGGSVVAGVLYLEICKITDLPPERNMTRTSFDMDPFVVTSLGKKTYRTRVVRHNLNPVYDEKLVFQVLRQEVNFSVSFAVVDRDSFSGNDFVGTVNLPLEKVTGTSPEADPETGLYSLPEPAEYAHVAKARKRFGIPLSRSSSSQSLSRLNKPALKKEESTLSIRSAAVNLDVPPGPGNAPLAPDLISESSSASPPTAPLNVGPDEHELTAFELPIDLKNKDRWESKHNPVLYIKARYLPYKALRQQFWKAMLRQYDADDSGKIDKVELTTMLDNLGSTLHEDTIDGFFKRFAGETGEEGEALMTIDQAVVCLEDQLQRTQPKSSEGSNGSETPSVFTPGVETPVNESMNSSSVLVLESDVQGKEGEEGATMSRDDLVDDGGEEHVIEIRECPICHQPRLHKRSDSDIITHIATCASQDWRQVNNLLMAGFVTSSQAQRKWYSKVITKISYGGYKLGANSANILVQDRLTGQINEERMSVYVRLGIRLLYKGLKSRDMEKKRIRKLLRSLSIKQGKKYDDPASASQIRSFIAFHQLDMSEVLLPTEQFKTFNQFFYRALNPGARPCCAPFRPEIITSPADCRSVVFNKLSDAQRIWVKGREFTIERLLGDAYPEDAKRYHNGALGIFRLAPQDYHRFHIPVDGILDEPKLIAGEYYTVNPMAIRSALDVYGENVRVIVPIDSEKHGRVMVICVGAMMVGSTVITRTAGEKVRRADELGYFKFGGSTLLVLFEPGMMQWDEDLADNSAGALETLIRVGMSMGHSPNALPHIPDTKTDSPTRQERMDAKRRIEGSLAPPMDPVPPSVPSDKSTP